MTTASSSSGTTATMGSHGRLADLSSPGLSTYSIIAISAISPYLLPLFITRVYPPCRSEYLLASTVNSLESDRSSLKYAAALLRAAKFPFLPSVIIWSATLRNSFAFGTVVVILSWWIKEVTMLRSIAFLCLDSLPSLRNAILCFIVENTKKTSFSFGFCIKKKQAKVTVKLLIRLI